MCSSCSGKAEAAGYCECGNDPRGYTICGEFLDRLTNYRFLQNSIPWTCHAAMSSASGICATEQGIRVQQQHVFKSLWQSYTCVLLRWQRRRLTPHTTLSHQAIIGQAGRHLFLWTSFLWKTNLNLCHLCQHHQTTTTTNGTGTDASVGNTVLITATK